MSLAVGQDVAAANDRVARLRSLLRALVEGLLDRWDVLVWNIVARCGVFEDT